MTVRKMATSLEELRDLDRWVAELVLGWRRSQLFDDRWYDPATGEAQGPLPCFSQDMTAAWVVVTWMQRELSTRHRFVAELRALMPTGTKGDVLDASHWIWFLDPELICRAALAVVRRRR